MILKFFNRRFPRRISPLFLFFILSCGCAQLQLSEAAANVLTNPELDPVAKIPEYKVCAVKLSTAA